MFSEHLLKKLCCYIRWTGCIKNWDHPGQGLAVTYDFTDKKERSIISRMSASENTKCTCCSHCSAVQLSVHQTLDEMEFERGIWSAAMNGELDRVKGFLDKGTNPCIVDKFGYTALHYASRSGSLSVCRILLQHGACVNAQTRGGATSLHRAAYCGHGDVVALLLSSGADPKISDDDGATPLHKAARCGHVEICKVLVKNCPSLKNLQDKNCRIPAGLVQNNIELMDLLMVPETVDC
ncbi:ankyrin repeat domain-containing protein 39 [Polypterus senegalus]|nr:ankyrin repeat domain-containing protein 39 [Polypterus senegalus]